jgi:hypothetical protein
MLYRKLREGERERKVEIEGEVRKLSNKISTQFPS